MATRKPIVIDDVRHRVYPTRNSYVAFAPSKEQRPHPKLNERTIQSKPTSSHKKTSRKVITTSWRVHQKGIAIIRKIPRLRLAAGGAVLLVVISGCLQLFVFKSPALHAQTITVGPNNPSSCVEEADGPVAWSNYGNSTTSDDSYTSVTVTTSTQGSRRIKCTSYGFNIPTGGIIYGIKMSVEKRAQLNSGSNTIADRDALLVKGGISQTTDDKALTLTAWNTSDYTVDYGGATDLWGLSWTPADINDTGFGAAFSISHGFSSTANTAYVDAITITVYYWGFSQLNMKGYIWENDDEDQSAGDAYDDNSQQAAGNTAITNVRKGERLALRMQISNSGSASPDNLGLFYDKNLNNQFTRVSTYTPQSLGGSGCASGAVEWICDSISIAGTVGTYSEVVTGDNGQPLVSYASAGAAYVAMYVGSNGTGCGVGGSSAWSCALVADTGAVTRTSITYANGKAYVAFTESGAGNYQYVADYVGSGGNCDTTLSGSDAWNCTAVSRGNGGTTTGIDLAAGSDGSIYMAYDSVGNSTGRLLYAKMRTSAGGNCDNDFTGSDMWDCTQITTNNAVAPQIAVNMYNIPFIVYHTSSTVLTIAEFVGSGGNCPNTTAWSCTVIDNTISTNIFKSIALSPNGTLHITYYDSSNGDLRLAYYDGDGTASGCSNTAWTCTNIASSGTVGDYSSIEFSPQGIPFISYYDNSTGDLMLAHYDGDASPSGCALNAWTCTVMDDTVANTGQYTSIAFGGNGTPYISYYDASNTGLRIARLNQGGEISLALPSGGTYGDAINESHSDMTSVTNTSNRDDADCIGGETWTNGKVMRMHDGVITLTNNACTEVVFIIDTSHAVAGTTYRFIIATLDGQRPDKAEWRGPISIDHYPTMTLASDTDFRGSKGSEFSATPCDLASWTCDGIDKNGIVGLDTSLAFSPAGIPYISYHEDNTNDSLRVAYFVGTGGNCDDVTYGGSDAWQCTTIETNGASTGRYSSIAFNAAGTPTISYYSSENTSLKIAQYVGSGGDCNGTTAWTCSIVDTTNTQQYTSLAMGDDGTAYISYYDATATSLKVAKQVGVGGNCAGNTGWECTTVDNTGTDMGRFTSIAISSAGIPYISYRDVTASDLRVAQYTGTGGTGCTSIAWSCTTVDASHAVDLGTSIAFNASGAPTISYADTAAGGDLYIAEYVGAGGSCTTYTGSAAWNCTQIYSDAGGNITGLYSSLAYSPNGKAYISYRTTSADGDLLVAQYVGSGGNCTNTAWQCSSVATTANVGQYTALAFSPTGVPYISYFDIAASDLRMAKLTQYDTAPVWQSLIANPGTSGRLGFGQYRLSNGQAARSGTKGLCGSAVANYMGICGLYDDGGHMESQTARANERPYFNFSQRYSSNSQLPTGSWGGRSDVAPNTAGTAGNIVLQVYRYGSTNAWETVATNTSSADCNTQNCYVYGIPGGPSTEYYQSDGGNYWIHWRVWQYENISGTETLRSDLFQLQFISDQMRHGNLFEGNVERNFTF